MSFVGSEYLRCQLGMDGGKRFPEQPTAQFARLTFGFSVKGYSKSFFYWSLLFILSLVAFILDQMFDLQFETARA